MFDTIATLTGKKATILKYGEMGFIHSILCEIKNVYCKDYAQYKNAIHVIYRPKGKRTDYVWRITYSETQFAVFAGHVALNTEMFIKQSTDSNGTTIKESGLSFSSGYMDRALASTNQLPLILNRKD